MRPGICSLAFFKFAFFEITRYILKQSGGTVPEKERKKLNLYIRRRAMANEKSQLTRYFEQVKLYPLLSKEEEDKLTVRAFRHQDQLAMENLITSNLRLVIKLVFNYHNPCHNILDLIQEGNTGLIHASRKYDPNKGTKFSTYASFWIRAYILKHIRSSWSLVRIGTTEVQKKLFFGINKANKKLEQEGIFNPDSRMLAESLGVTAEQIEEMKALLSNTISLDSPLRGDKEEIVMNKIITNDKIEETVIEEENRKNLQQKIQEFKDGLNKLERTIFENRLASEEPLTLQEIGDRFSLSRERVRQIQVKILRRFTEYMDGFQT